MNVNVYEYFIDYHWVFDSIRYYKRIEIFLKTGVDSWEINLATELYWNQFAKVRPWTDISQSAQFEKWFKQVHLAFLINLYSDAISDEAVNDSHEGSRLVLL